MRAFRVTAIVIILTTQAAAHSGGLNKQGCHAGSQPYCLGPLKLCQYLLTKGVGKNGTEAVFG